MFGWRKRTQKASSLEAPAVWNDILGSLKPDAPYTRRIEAILTALDKAVGFDAYYLYLLDATGERFALEHMKARPVGGPETAEGEIPAMSVGDEYEDVHSILRSPLLDFPYNTRHNEAHVTTTRAGEMYATPLRRDGRLAGLLQMGPLGEDGMPESSAQQVNNLLVPLSFTVTQARQEEDLRQRLQSLETQSEVSQRMLSSAFEMDEFIALLLDLALTATSTEAGFVAITEPDSNDLTIRADENMSDEFLEQVNLEMGEGLFDWVEMSEEKYTLILRDYEFVQEMGIQSILAVPLVEGGRLQGLFDPGQPEMQKMVWDKLVQSPLQGVFALVNYQKGETFADHSLKLLSSFAEQIRLVLDNVRLLDQFTQRYLETVKALNKAVDVRDPTTVSHTERVTTTAVEIAERLGLSTHEVDVVRTAAQIHDVGMCGITEAAQGFQADYNHPTIGADMIRVLALPSGVAEAVASHHEWFDGWGYPNGLKGNEITLGGRILALAEYFVETTTFSELQPMPAWSKLKEEIEVRKGSQFDPEVVDALLAIMEEKRTQTGDGVLEGCTRFKACPADLQAECPAQDDPDYCFRHRPEGVRCEGHGDPACETCFLYVEREERVG